MNRLHDLTGQRFTRLTVISRAESRNGQVYWHCKCDCGNEKDVRASHLIDGSTKSCGCLNNELCSTIARTYKPGFKHGAKKERLYRVWKGIHSRCNNPNMPKYARYGGRGIRVCGEWDEYLPFKKWALENGYADNLCIDRINNDGNYEPSNCRWVTSKQNSNNTSRVHLFTVNGETHTLSEWSDISGIPARTIWARIHYGVEPERVLNKGDLRSGRKQKRTA